MFWREEFQTSTFQGLCRLTQFSFSVTFIIISVTWLITMGGGEAKLTMGIGTLFYKGVRFERGENLAHKTQVLHFLFSVYFLFAIIQFSNQINYS
jgi:hypothetical protein